MGCCSSQVQSEPRNMMNVENTDSLEEKQISAIFDNYDQNKDGQLDRKEAALVCRHIMKTLLDTSKERLKQIPKEMRVYVGSMFEKAIEQLEAEANDEKKMEQMADAIVTVMDSNNDNVIQKQEFIANFRKTFDNLVNQGTLSSSSSSQA
eukprot:TRINITY_DN440_c0_g1_i1.p1 TRINITY_DN440_c0_g1~~TRINITY_DN440_c0_g1_i1.p1  ORF type:complete len:150 (-),score=39.13 TRINITY_DN440_c0_g1_i1:113-562(-)